MSRWPTALARRVQSDTSRVIMLDGLVQYARAKDPARELPANVRLVHDEHTLTIFDIFPKAKYHFLVLPRLPLVLPTENTNPPDKFDYLPSDLDSLSSLLRLRETSSSSLSSASSSSSRNQSTSSILTVLNKLKEAAEDCVAMIKDEMNKTEGFCWDVWVGFHAVPSMRHIHLHVISSDLVSPALKTKKHYNSFRPDAGFFLSLDDVIRMITDDKDSRLPKSKHEYEAILKSDLECFRCGELSPNMPALKAHLEEEWTRLRSRASALA